MAKVLDPLHSGDARGTVSGVIYSRTKYGYSARRKGMPVRRVRSTQPYNRGVLGFLARSWGVRTNPERESWRDWAATHPRTNSMGQVYQQSGFNAYVGLNSLAIRLGELVAVPGTSAPVADLAIGMASLVAVDGVGGGVINLDWTHLGVGVAADFNEIQIAGPFTSQGRVEVTNYRFETEVAGNLMTGVTSALEEGAWYWLRVRYVGVDGQTSAWLYTQHMAPVVP